MFCRMCGKQVNEGGFNCPYCGASLNPENEIQANPLNNQMYAYQNNGNVNANAYGNSNNQYNSKPYSDEPNIFLVIASFMIPLLGIILFSTEHRRAPKKAKTYGMAALACVILNFLTIAIGCCTLMFSAV